MGLFDKFKKKNESKVGSSITTNMDLSYDGVAESVDDSEKAYYQDDQYYQTTTHKGTIFEKTVVRFDERNSYPSINGLQVAEILLLHYCKRGNYPHPANGYPGFWWFKYGIRDVTKALKTLETKGFICFGPIKNALNQLKVPELKALLLEKDLPQTGKKQVLLSRVCDNFSDQELIDIGLESKYVLTELGELELQSNEYVPFMHSNHYTTIEGCGENVEFNVWSINRALHSTNCGDWKTLVIQEFNRTHVGKDLLTTIFKADFEYQVMSDRQKYLRFWEDLWAKGKLDIDIPHWIFMLPKMYLEDGRYDEALELTRKANQLYDKQFEEEASALIEKIEKKKGK